MAQYMAADLLI